MLLMELPTLIFLQHHHNLNLIIHLFLLIFIHVLQNQLLFMVYILIILQHFQLIILIIIIMIINSMLINFMELMLII